MAASRDGEVGVIAIDGPSGSGKSTVSRGLAARLGVPYLDTGAMYRAATWAVLHAKVNPADAAAVGRAVAAAELEVGIDPAAPNCEVDGLDVGARIRGPEVTAVVSAVAAVPTVRQQLVAQQRQIIASALRGETEFSQRGIVVEGRDIATVVAPDAVLKVYLTASVAARASRRRSDAAGTAAPQLADVQRDLQRRDTLDSTRSTDPLRQATDATLLDTTVLSVDEVVDRLVELHAAAVAALR
ncbi:MAG: (d)CMP kinase [Acidimicrobiales bacterium]|nr:MAG: (d)CMP kinase [Acidimicrobiales bacterium]